ncbi:RecX family transcriptional regulator [Sphingomonas nostoxanthinifaciens]|uniref:RecX family transcriptional regulator n=1 Tax=Sphingomonas nostoxanthinifaciens TaxID=2872652 RepID=UPI001CC1CF1E|nr:RecX family transcriptional regulator [Sphingomonas nostoxanthinifaciens]UAK24898.1 RecX family transcriptional regulator [Sphingomonas nostoxanthinifaciens]
MFPNFKTQGRKPPSPIDAARLDALALGYVGRYATSRAKLAAYLVRKLDVAGWAGEGEAPVAAVVARLAALGYVDDAAFARARGAALGRRGYGARRVSDALRAAGVEAEDAAPAQVEAQDEALARALAFARRRRVGPYADAPLDRPARERALGAMLRAGHALEVARRVINALPGDEIDSD